MLLREASEHAGGECAGGAEPDDEGDVLGAGPQAVLLAGADDQRRQLDAPAHIERADALGRVELVAGDRQQIDAELLHVDGDLADRLRGIRVHQRAARLGGAGDLAHRLQGADLVLRMDDGDERRPIVDRGRQCSAETMPLLSAARDERHGRCAAGGRSRPPSPDARCWW